MRTVLPSEKFKLLDFIIILSIILLTVAFVIIPNTAKSESESILITTKTETLSFSLNSERIENICSGGYNYAVTIHNGEVSVTNADCPDKICMKSRPVSSKGGSIICVPGGLIIKGGQGTDADIIIP